jgi:hypothetical protein
MPYVDSKISEVVTNAPEWARRDLVSRDATIRLRAEETLTAMIANVLPDRAGNAPLRLDWLPPAQSVRPEPSSTNKAFR